MDLKRITSSCSSVWEILHPCGSVWLFNTVGNSRYTQTALKTWNSDSLQVTWSTSRGQSCPSEGCVCVCVCVFGCGWMWPHVFTHVLCGLCVVRELLLYKREITITLKLFRQSHSQEVLSSLPLEWKLSTTQRHSVRKIRTTRKS